MTQEPAALQALIADASARLVELAEAGSSNQTVVDSGSGAGTGPGAESARLASKSTQGSAPGAASTSRSLVRSKPGGAATTQQRHATDDLEEGTFEGSVDAMDAFLDDLGHVTETMRGYGVRRAVRAEGERSDAVALADPTGSLNIAEIRPVAKEALVCEELAANLGTAPPMIESRKLVAPLDGAILRNVLSQEECASLIASTDGMGYSFWDPDEKRRDFRSADTVEVHSKALAKALWDRILPHIAELTAVKVEEMQSRWERETDGDWTAYGVNHELLFGRYRAGGHFSPHTDGNTVVDFNDRSLYSMIVYLNDCEDGGSTRMLVLEPGDSFSTDASGRFRGREENVVDSCPVEAGSVLLFYQNIVHEGEPVGMGSMKYIIRTDLMFRRNNPFCDSASDVEAFRLMKEAEEIENTQQGPASANKAAGLFRQAFRMSPALAKVYGS
eukprot:COSAG02_NODE_33_length_50286_cov_83.550760_34_plen_445_part_00